MAFKLQPLSFEFVHLSDDALLVIPMAEAIDESFLSLEDIQVSELKLLITLNVSISHFFELFECVYNRLFQRLLGCNVGARTSPPGV